MEKIDFREQFESIPKPSIMEKTPIESNEKEIDLDQTWKILWEHIKMNTSERVRDIWFKGVYLENISGGVAAFSCPDQYKREWVESNHRMLLKKSLLEITGIPLEVVFRVSENTSTEKKEKSRKYEFYDPNTRDLTNDLPIFNQASNTDEIKAKSRLKAQLNPRYLMNNFIV